MFRFQGVDLKFLIFAQICSRFWFLHAGEVQDFSDRFWLGGSSGSGSRCLVSLWRHGSVALLLSCPGSSRVSSIRRRLLVGICMQIWCVDHLPNRESAEVHMIVVFYGFRVVFFSLSFLRVSLLRGSSLIFSRLRRRSSVPKLAFGSVLSSLC